MTEYLVEWSNVYEATSRGDALRQALAGLDDAINRRVGETGFIVVESETARENAKIIDIEFQGICDECDGIYSLTDEADRCHPQ